MVLFARAQGKAYVAVSDGTKFLPPAPWQPFFAVSLRERPLVADLNGDGRDDIVTFTTDSPTAYGDVYVALNVGGAFAYPAVKWHDFFGVNPSEIVRAGDLDGDGRQDFYTFLPPPWGQCYTVLSRGDSMGPNVLWPVIVTPEAKDVPFVGDVNGDRRDDSIVFDQLVGSASRANLARLPRTAAGTGEVAVLGRFAAYLEKRFNLRALVAGLHDGRLQRRIPTRAVWLAAFGMYVLRLRSLNALEQELRLGSRWEAWIGARRPSADTIGRPGQDVSGPDAPSPLGRAARGVA